MGRQCASKANYQPRNRKRHSAEYNGGGDEQTGGRGDRGLKNSAGSSWNRHHNYEIVPSASFVKKKMQVAALLWPNYAVTCGPDIGPWRVSVRQILRRGSFLWPHRQRLWLQFFRGRL